MSEGKNDKDRPATTAPAAATTTSEVRSDSVAVTDEVSAAIVAGVRVVPRERLADYVEERVVEMGPKLLEALKEASAARIRAAEIQREGAVRVAELEKEAAAAKADADKVVAEKTFAEPARERTNRDKETTKRHRLTVGGVLLTVLAIVVAPPAAALPLAILGGAMATPGVAREIRDFFRKKDE